MQGRIQLRFRFGFDGQNPMSNKNLVFDEVHNLLALPRLWQLIVSVAEQVEGKLLEGQLHHMQSYWMKRHVKEPLRRLRKAVADSRGSTLVRLESLCSDY